MAYLRPVGRPYGTSTAHWKAVQLILRTVSRTYDQFRASLKSSLDSTSGEISYVFSYIFYGFIKTIMEAICKWFHFLSTASV